MSTNLNYNNLPLDPNTNETQQISDYTVKESKDRLDKLSNLFNQHIGINWKFTLFLIFLFIISLSILIRYGLELYSSHINLFLSIFILSILFFIIWVIILPEKNTTIYGIVPFPKNSPYIPVDSTQCGLSPTICQSNTDCDTKCKNKDGNDNYTCTNIGNKNVFYLGTQLDKDKSFCLPKQGNQIINSCGTYTGRAVWSANNDKQSWSCKCLYPDIYNGDTCTDIVDENSDYCLKSDPKTCWNNSNMPTELINKSPYDTSLEIVCKDGYNFYGGSCNKDICYMGEGNTTNSKFDNNTKKCVCTSPTFQSNISGFCFPDVSNNCNPHPNTNKCIYDIDIGGQTEFPLFKLNNIPVLSYNISYPILVDMSDSNLVTQPLIEMKNTTVLKDAFYSFPIIKFSNLKQTDQDNIKNNIIKKVITDNDGLSAIFSKKSKTPNETVFGVAKLCNSFYYKNVDSNDEKYNCSNMLSPTGTDYDIFITGNLQNDCGQGSTSCNFNLSSQNGRNCTCSQGQIYDSNGKCINCLGSGTQVTYETQNLCCNGASIKPIVGTEPPVVEYICK